MTLLPRRVQLLLCAAALAWAPVAAAEPPSPATVPPATVIALDDANLLRKADLDLRYETLVKRLEAWKRRGEAFNRAYADRELDEGSVEAKAAATEQAWLVRELTAYTKATARFASDVGRLQVDRTRRIAAVVALAKELPWSKEERDRLASALNALELDGDLKVTAAALGATWKAIEARGQDAGLAREAAKGRGPGPLGAGTQSFNDCTIFALAQVSGQPYGVVAARATQVIRDGPWRGTADRAHAQQVIERHGLDGYEVILLAEAFGQAEVVKSTDFARTLEDGRPVLVAVNVLDEDGDPYLHQVVLTRTFPHAGETWYEMQDSNQGPAQRRYLSGKELHTMLQENGVAYRPEPGATPGLLRKPDAK